MSGFDSKSFIEEADQELSAADDWERLEVFVELCSDDLFGDHEGSNYSSVKSAWDYLTEQKRVIRKSAFNHILRMVDSLEDRREILPFLDRKLLELKLLSHDRSAGIVDVLIKKTRSLKEHYSRGNAQDENDTSEEYSEEAEDRFREILESAIERSYSEHENDPDISLQHDPEKELVVWAGLWGAYSEVEDKDLKHLLEQELKYRNRAYVEVVHQDVSEMESVWAAIDEIENKKLHLRLFEGLHRDDDADILSDLVEKLDVLAEHWRTKAQIESHLEDSQDADTNPDQNPVEETNLPEPFHWQKSERLLIYLFDRLLEENYLAAIDREQIWAKVAAFFAKRDGESRDNKQLANQYNQLFDNKSGSPRGADKIDSLLDDLKAHDDSSN